MTLALTSATVTAKLFVGSSAFSLSDARPTRSELWGEKKAETLKILFFPDFIQSEPDPRDPVCCRADQLLIRPARGGKRLTHCSGSMAAAVSHRRAIASPRAMDVERMSQLSRQRPLKRD